MTVEHDYFGLLETRDDGSVWWTDTVELAELPVTVTVTAPSEAELTTSALNAAAQLISGLELTDARARDAMMAQLAERSSEVVGFVTRQYQRFGDGLWEVLADHSGDRHRDLIHAIPLRAITVYPSEYGVDGGPFIVTDYGFDPDDPRLDTGDIEDEAEEDLLRVGFRSSLEVASITSEN